MRRRLIQLVWHGSLVLIACVWTATLFASADDLAWMVTRAELATSRAWFQMHFQGQVGALPFSFRYGEQWAPDLLTGWKHASKSTSLDADRTQRHARDVWMAWQWARPAVGKGVVHAFRREKSSESTKRFPLHGLDPNATYRVEDADARRPVRRRGRELLEEGIVITLPAPRSAALVFYERVP